MRYRLVRRRKMRTQRVVEYDVMRIIACLCVINDT